MSLIVLNMNAAWEDFEIWGLSDQECIFLNAHNSGGIVGLLDSGFQGSCNGAPMLPKWIQTTFHQLVYQRAQNCYWESMQLLASADKAEKLFFAIFLPSPDQVERCEDRFRLALTFDMILCITDGRFAEIKASYRVPLVSETLCYRIHNA